MSRLQFIVDVRIPALVRNAIEEQCKHFMEHYRHVFRMETLIVHLHHEGPMTACSMSMLTDDGHYHATAIEWDVRTAARDALENLETQITKHTQKHYVRHVASA